MAILRTLFNYKSGKLTVSITENNFQRAVGDAKKYGYTITETTPGGTFKKLTAGGFESLQDAIFASQLKCLEV